MLLLIFFAFCGVSARFQQEQICDGSEVTFKTPPDLHRGSLYFTPRNGGTTQILMEDGKVNDPRLKASTFEVRLTHLTKKDEGVYSASLGMGKVDMLRLKIRDCTDEISKTYMDNLEYKISQKAEYLEFTPLDNKGITLILWNRTDSSKNDIKRGNVKYNVWEIPGVVQTDNGFYSFRRSDGSLDSRIHLTVKEYTQYYDPVIDERLFIHTPWTGGPWTVTFKPNEDKYEEVTVMKDGRLVSDNHILSGRIVLFSSGFSIDRIEDTDTGTFEFRDPQGNLALSAKVDVSHISGNGVPLIIGVVVALLLGICCCYCCCKRKCCKKDKPAVVLTQGPVTYHDNSAPAPAVYYHDTNQPTTSSYSNQPYPSVYPPHPVNPPSYSIPAAVSIEPPPNTSVYPLQPPTVSPPQPEPSLYPSTSEPNTSVYPPQPMMVSPPQPEPSLYPPTSEAGPPTSQESAAAPIFPSEVLSSDDEPRFELKGLAFPSAPPLSSDPPSSDVYNSSKLNFL